jgi:hypothetical protein
LSEARDPISELSMRRRIPHFLAVIAGAAAACGNGPAPGTGPSPDAFAVLFVGNSLTYTNNLPGVVEAGGVDADVRGVAFPNFGLEDHWVEGSARTLIAAGGWDMVAMQQGPSATEGRPSLLDYSARFAAEIRAAGGEPALYMVWPSSARSFDFPGVESSYADAAEAVDGILLPAGSAWLEAWEEDPDLALYGPDGFHPSPIGTLLAALTIVDRLADVDIAALPLALPGSAGPLPVDVKSLLVAAARAANARWAEAAASLPR